MKNPKKNKVFCTLRKEEEVRGHLGKPAPNDAVKMLTTQCFPSIRTNTSKGIKNKSKKEGETERDTKKMKAN